MWKMVRKYGGTAVVATALSSVAIFGLEEQAAHRLCNPVPYSPLWVSLGLIALLTTMIMLYVIGTDSAPSKPTTVFSHR